MTNSSLSGVRVLELANFVVAPLAGRVLADLGASVYKVERPGRGDDGRHFPPFFGDTGVFYIQCNRNKESIASSTSAWTPVGLSCWAWWRSATYCLPTSEAGRWPGSASITRPGPSRGLVYCAVSGFGAGPDANGCLTTPACRLCADSCVRQDLRRSVRSVSDRPSSTTPPPLGRSSLLAALRERESTGQGQLVDESLLGTALDIMANDIGRYVATQARPRRPRPANCIEHPTGSGCSWRWVTIASSRACARWWGNRSSVGIPVRHRAARGQRSAAISEIFERIFASRTAAEWEVDLVAHGVPAAKVRHIDEVVGDEALVGNRIENYVDDAGRVVPQVRTPVDFFGHEPQLRQPPQRLGKGRSLY